MFRNEGVGQSFYFPSKRMKDHEEKIKLGEFYISSEPIIGQLTLDRENSVLELYSKEFFNSMTTEGKSIKGILSNNQKVSLINCLTLTGLGQGYKGGQKYHFSTIFPHYVVFGDEHVDGENTKILSIHAFLEDATDIFYDFGVFGHVLEKEYDIKSVVKHIAENRESEEVIGERPELFYFTGKEEIFKVETALGNISASHNPSYSLPSPDGIQIKNSIPIHINFKSPVSFQDAINNFWFFLGFIDLIAGIPQKIKRFYIKIQSEKEDTSYFDVYWCLPPNKNKSDRFDRKPHPMDVLINGAIQSQEFAAVLRAWLAKQKEWRDSRNRFIQSFRQQNSYTIDRLVGAANMFDILPESAVGEANEICEEIKKICNESKKLWKSCADSPEKNSILGALGRIGKHNLKTKIKNRAKILTEKLPQKFPDIETVIDEAVNCRNYYVHGTSQGKLTPENRSEFGPFFIDTLEFIFGASDLIEAGWNINRWVEQGSCLTHPYGLYLYGYNQRIEAFKYAITKEASTKCI